MTKCIVMFSGGLDSTIAVHLLKQQGIEVVALHYVLPFYSGNLMAGHTAVVREYARELGVELRLLIDEEEFLRMLKNPAHGYGKNVNPCKDCRIYHLQQAKKIMAGIGAAFIATGEVLGQRPMSQGRLTMEMIEKQAGLCGLLVRPLCAGLLPPSQAEIAGLINRELLMSIKGRGRREQLAYAKQFGLRHDAPAGGCLLTQEMTTVRLHALTAYKPDYSLNDLALIAYGRHFRISHQSYFVVARDEAEVKTLDALFCPGDIRITMADVMGPLGLVRGTATPQEIGLMGSVLCRYSKARNSDIAQVRIEENDNSRVIQVKPATKEQCESMQVK